MYIREPFGNRDALKLPAAGKRFFGDVRYAARDRNAFNSRTRKRLSTYVSNAIMDNHIFKMPIHSKSANTNILHTASNCYVYKVRAPNKRPSPYCLNTVWDNNTF